MTTEHPDRAAPFGEIAGVVLAGGRSQRMGGGNKALLTLGGQPLLARIVERAAPQVAALVVNANGDPADVSAYGLPVVSDGVSGFVGPLAGVLSGMEWAAARGGYRWVASFAADTPFFPVDLVARLAAAATEADAPLALAASGGRTHPVFGLWSLALRSDLRRALVDEGLRKVNLWTARHRPVCVDFAVSPLDPFFNINNPDDLAQAESLLPAVEATGRMS